MILGITGVFGSGKTTVAKMFVRYGYKHINADLIGHKLLDKKSVRDKVVKEFGKGILRSGKIDRRKLKDVVFYNHSKLIKLNEIIHPLIIKEIKKMVKGNVIVDGALLVEVKCLKLFDKLIVVKINKKEQLKRVMKKNKYTKKEVMNILKSQLSQKEKLKCADYVIDNSKTMNMTEKQVKSVINSLKS